MTGLSMNEVRRILNEFPDWSRQYLLHVANGIGYNPACYISRILNPNEGILSRNVVDFKFFEKRPEKLSYFLKRKNRLCLLP